MTSINVVKSLDAKQRAVNANIWNIKVWTPNSRINVMVKKCPTSMSDLLACTAHHKCTQYDKYLTSHFYIAKPCAVNANIWIIKVWTPNSRINVMVKKYPTSMSDLLAFTAHHKCTQYDKYLTSHLYMAKPCAVNANSWHIKVGPFLT